MLSKAEQWKKTLKEIEESARRDNERIRKTFREMQEADEIDIVEYARHVIMGPTICRN